MTCLARNARRKNGNARSSFHSALLLFVTMVLFSTWCLSTGKGPMCAINRSSIFFLLSIQIHLCDLVRSLYVDITVRLSQRKSQGLIWKVLSVGIPCLLVAISYGGLCEFIDVCHRSLMFSSFLTTNACHQLNVATRHAITATNARTVTTTTSMWRGMHFRAQWGLFPLDPFGALACALCRRRIKFLDVSVLSDDVRFSNMGTEWGGYHLHLLFDSLLYRLSVLLWCLSLFSWVTLNSYGVCEIGLVWWDVAILCAQCLLFFLGVVTLMTFPLVMMLRKGSFHLEQRIYDFVLPGLWRSWNEPFRNYRQQNRAVCDVLAVVCSYDEAFVYSFDFLCNW